MKIVSVATHMPYVGIPHAGGDYFARHAALLSESHDLTVVCPWTPANEEALNRPMWGSYERIVVPPRVPKGGQRGGHRSLLARALPFVAMSSFCRALLADEQLRSTLTMADRIELHWFDTIVLAPRLRGVSRCTPITGIYHDVVSQGYRRKLTAPNVAVVHRLLALVRWALAIPFEVHSLRALDTAVVLSEKDRGLLARRGRVARILVVAPPLDEEGMPTAPPSLPDTMNVLFVGALWRSENEDAAIWLLKSVWPIVLQKLPQARLTIAGADPTRHLQSEVGRCAEAELTGRVESLAPSYQNARVAVAPLRLGAGVKLKSIAAMLWGVPVVATDVGAEGIDGPDVFAAVTNDEHAFAAAVVRLLTCPSAAQDVAARAHAWSHAHYTMKAYHRWLTYFYS